MWESKLFLTSHDTTRHDSTELFKIFFSLLTLQLLFCKKLVGREIKICKDMPKLKDKICLCISHHQQICIAPTARISWSNLKKYCLYSYWKILTKNVFLRKSPISLARKLFFSNPPSIYLFKTLSINIIIKFCHH